MHNLNKELKGIHAYTVIYLQCLPLYTATKTGPFHLEVANSRYTPSIVFFRSASNHTIIVLNLQNQTKCHIDLNYRPFYQSPSLIFFISETFFVCLSFFSFCFFFFKGSRLIY